MTRHGTGFSPFRFHDPGILRIRVGSAVPAPPPTAAKRALFVSTSDVNSLSTLAFEFIIKIVNPEFIVFDDFDRVDALTKPALLYLMEKLNSEKRIIIATVNDINFIEGDKALGRPQRFDKFIEISNLDEAIIKLVLTEDIMQKCKGYDIDIIDVVKFWPVSYIEELKRILVSLDVSSKEELNNHIFDLQKRLL